MTQKILSARDIRIAFDMEEGRLEAVRGVSLDIFQGEILGIIGESGCGKSLTALSLMKLIPTGHGHLSFRQFTLNGKEVANLPNREFKELRSREVSIIFQDPMSALNPVMPIFSQLVESIQRNPEVNPSDFREYAAELLLKMGLADVERVLDSYPHELSGGMRQRVMIAMALACKPKILIADEPTTALDLTVQAQILNLLLELREKENLSILFITHDLGIVSNLCDRILVMYAGKVVEQGKSREIFTCPQHPYTLGLIQSLLDGSHKPKQKLPAIPGNVPSLEDIPSGCAFHDRCLYAGPECSTEEPAFKTTGEGKGYACHFPPGVKTEEVC